MALTQIAQSTKPLPSSTSSQTARSISPLAIARARLLMGSWRKIEADDPKTFAATIAKVLSAYPDDVIEAVTDPAGPYRLAWKFPPDAPEIHAACERAMAPRYEASSRAAEHRRIEAQLAERDRVEAARQAMREDQIQRLEACADELQQPPDGRDLEPGLQDIRARTNAALDRMRAQHCSVETPSGIPISPRLRELLDGMIAAARPPDPNARHNR